MSESPEDALVHSLVEEVVDSYHETVTDTERFAFLPRGIEYQREAIRSLSDFIDYAEEIKRDLQIDEEIPGRAANQVLALICMAKAVRHELRMWIRLKEENWESAWTDLVDAQEYASSAIAADSIARYCNVKTYQEKLGSIESSIFPPQQFVSPGLIVNTYECSICGEDYDTCPHLQGIAYNGVICSRILRDIEAREVSFVDDPRDKKARVRGHHVEDGFRNQMTWEIEEDTEGSEHLVDETPDHVDDDEVEDFLRIEAAVMTADDGGDDFSEFREDSEDQSEQNQEM
ncbi:CxxC motif protein [Halorubrum virus Humcor2]|uniref:hypothetical protein n=1 Tax=Halorubrum coriense TaxID=64713 RepID=UPI0012682F40|nr:hypothetical protein [Halorubrum coriense]QRG24097.1 CxxC motif protein [Halorubrum virus Humcor2]